MFIKNLSFENYRNLKNASLSPSENINIIYGSNAQGKTNLIECMWLLTGGRSFRGAKDRELITFDKKFSRVKADFFSTNREQTVEILIQNNKRTPFLNGIQKNYMSEIIGSFCAVIFSPNHLALVREMPSSKLSPNPLILRIPLIYGTNVLPMKALSSLSTDTPI